MALGRLDSVTSPAQPRRSTALQQFSLTSTSPTPRHAAHLHGHSTLLTYLISTLSTMEELQEMRWWRREKVRGNFPSSLPLPTAAAAAAGRHQWVWCARIWPSRKCCQRTRHVLFCTAPASTSHGIVFDFCQHTSRTTDADILGTHTASQCNEKGNKTLKCSENKAAGAERRPARSSSSGPWQHCFAGPMFTCGFFLHYFLSTRHNPHLSS